MRFPWILAALAAAACATAQLRDTWKDPAYTGPPLKEVLVVGVSKSDASRRVFEDGFAAAMNASGSHGIASYHSLPENGAIPNERLDQAVKKVGADGVLVTRVLRVKRNVDVTPGYMGPGFYGMGYHGFYRGAWAAMPPDVDVYDVISLETTLWNMKTNKPVWSGMSEVTEPKNVGAATEELAKLLIGKMKADGVI